MLSTRIEEFDAWRPGYGLATVIIYEAGTTVLASVFLNQALTIAASNPQTLLEKTDNGISYGKFAAPLYVGVSYQLTINSVDQTGIINPPLTTLDGQDASQATVVATGASEVIALADYLARIVDVRNYGAFLAVGQSGASASTNNATIEAAVAVASAQGGGIVTVPAGTYQFTDFVLPLGVVIVGAGREATILQSTIADKVITISGERAGFRHLTLDGISQVTNSIGVFAELIDQIVFDDTEIKRFDTGLQRLGGSNCDWRDLYISDCLTGYQGHGDSDSGNGGPLENNRWTGGAVQLCSVVGIELKDIDELCDHNTFVGLALTDNTGIAAHIIGARSTKFEDCYCSGNTTDLKLEDGSPLNANQDNTVIGFEWNGGSFSGTSPTSLSAIDLLDTLESVAFRRVEFENVTVTLTTPGHNVLVQDCREISGVSFAGTPTAWIRSKTYDRGESSGVTTGNAPTIAWSITLKSGQHATLDARVVARCRNNVNSAHFRKVLGVYCGGATLLYDTATAAFTAGAIVTGQTSKATARIIIVAPSGSNGTLTLQDVEGTFLNNETITDSAGGSALVNGSLTLGTTGTKTVTDIYGPIRDDGNWNVTFTATGQEIFLNVTGDTAMNVEWVIDVDVVSLG